MGDYISYNKLVNLIDLDYSKTVKNVELVIFSSLSFFIPFFLSHSQLIVGIIVNFTLFMGSMNFKKYELLPVIFLPSIAVFSRGLIFGSLTTYLLYFIPFIWLSNILLVLFFKHLKFNKNKKNFLSISITSLIKASFLFSIAAILFISGFIPKIFLIVMGPIQLLSAFIGGNLAFMMQKFKHKTLKKYIK